MSCQCNQTVLPTIDDDCALAAPLAVTTPCCTDPETLSSVISEGAVLPSWATDAVCASVDVTLLGRIGTRLARLAGTGFIKITSGKASVVSAIPLKLIDLWHNWWKLTSTSTPILGEPLAFPYQVVADSQGNLHGIKGKVDEDSVALWNHTAKQFEMTPVSELDNCVKGLIPFSAAIELVGYEPIAEGGAQDALRCLKALSGSGIIVVNQVATIDAITCPQEVTYASVTSFLPFPTDVTKEYHLTYTVADGPTWTEIV